LAQADTAGQGASGFQLSNGGVRRVLVYVQNASREIPLGAEYLATEALRRVRISFCSEQKINRLARGIHGSVQILVLALDLLIRPVNAATLIGGLQMRPALLVHRRECLQPAPDAACIPTRVAFRQKLGNMQIRPAGIAGTTAPPTQSYGPGNVDL
jgi:hypothetical protein